MTGPHHRGTYAATKRRVVAAAKANPGTVCWRDGLTLAQHAEHKDGTRPEWTAGHTVDGWIDAPAWLNVTRRPPPGPWLAPEASTCNYSQGAHTTNRFRANPHSRAWFGAANSCKRELATLWINLWIFRFACG